jgi:uncharacterized protein YbjQ (UPF0145 family)
MKIIVTALGAALLLAAPLTAQIATPSEAAENIKASDLPSPPVIAGDITDRPYTVIGQITAGVRKATVFSKSSSPEKIYRELWERGEKMHADAVIHASFGKAHVSAMSWGQTTATGTAIKFNDAASAGQN